MNKVTELLKDHRSIRKFKEQEISNELIDEILNCATWASTSGNMQAYSIIVTRDKKMKERMLSAHFNQDVYSQAPVFLTFCADFHRKRKWISLRGAANNFDNFMSYMIASIDAILASQNAAIAAESMGLGICYLGTTLASACEIGEILELPENVIPVVGFALGYPDEKPEARKRLPLEGVVHYENYRKYSCDEIISIYKDKEKEGYERYQSQPAFKKLSIENLAQIYTQIKYTEESHLKYSRDLLCYLEKQKFL